MAQYATRPELAAIGLPAQALAGIATATQDIHLVKASAKIDSYLRSRYSLPLGTPYPDEIVEACALLAAYSLLVYRGFNPASYDENFRLRHEDTLTFLRDLSAGRATLSVTADATASTLEGAPRVQTGGTEVLDGTGTVGELRGW